MLLSGAEDKRRMHPQTYKSLIEGQKDAMIVETIALGRLFLESEKDALVVETIALCRSFLESQKDVMIVETLALGTAGHI